MNDNKDCWKMLKKFGDDEDSEIPTEINNNGETVRKHQELAELANDHFIKKVEDIQKEIPTTNADPIQILKNLIPRVENEATFPLIKLEETKKIIRELKNSNSSGMDNNQQDNQEGARENGGIP